MFEIEDTMLLRIQLELKATFEMIASMKPFRSRDRKRMFDYAEDYLAEKEGRVEEKEERRKREDQLIEMEKKDADDDKFFESLGEICNRLDCLSEEKKRQALKFAIELMGVNQEALIQELLEWGKWKLVPKSTRPSPVVAPVRLPRGRRAPVTLDG